MPETSPAESDTLVLATMNELNRIHGDLPQRLGFTIESASREEATGRLVIDPALRQGLSVLHGGVIFAFADAVAASMICASDNGGSTKDAQIRYLEPVTESELHARSRLVHARGRSALVEVEVRGTDERLVALYSASFVRPRG